MLKGRLKEVREAAGISQTELGKRVGVKQATVCEYERGFKTPSVEVLARIAIELKCTTDYLLGLEAEATQKLIN